MQKVLKWAGYILLPIFIIIFLVILNWKSISYYAFRKAAHYYAGKADIELKIGRLSGSPFSETRIEDFSIRPGTAQPQVFHFKAQSITCTYNLRDLKEGYEIFLQGLSCRADTPEFNYDFRVASQDDQSGQNAAPFFIPAILPRIELHNGAATLTDFTWKSEITKVNAILDSAAAAHELQLEVGSFKFIQDDVPKIDTEFTSLLQYGGERLTIESFAVGKEEIAATGFIDLSRMNKDYFEFAAEVAFTASRLNLEGSLHNRRLQLDAGTENFDIGELQRRLGGTGWDVSGKIRGEVNLSSHLDAIEDFNGSFTVEVLNGLLHGVDIDAVSLIGSFQNETLNVSAAEARTSGNHIRVSEVTIPLPLLQGGEPLSIMGGSRAKFDADIADFATFMQLIRVEEDVIPEVVRPNSLTIHGNLGKGTLHLADGRAETSGSNLSVIEAAIPIAATIEAFESVPLNIRARFESSSIQEIAGLFGDISLNGQAAVDIIIAGSFREPKARINLSGEYLSFKEMQLGGLSLQGDIRLVQEKPGTVKSIGIEVTEMTQANGTGTLALLAPMTGNWQDDIFSMTGVFQLDNKGEIAANISRTPGKEIAVDISTRSLDSDGWLGNFIDARYFFHGADIEAGLLGIFENTQLQLSGTVSEAGATNVDFPLSGSFNLHYTSKGIEIAEFTWRSLERNQLTITGYLPYDPMAIEPFLADELTLKGHIDFPALEDFAVFLEPWGIATGSAALDMDLAGSWDRPEGNILFQAEGLAPPESLRKYMNFPVNLAVEITVQDDSIILKSGRLESTAYTAQATGSWQHGIAVKELLQKGRSELRGEVSADATIQLRDLNFLRQKLPWLRRLEGDMQGELHLAGAASKPSLKGSFSLRDGEARHSFNFPMLSAVNLQGDFDERSITIKNLQAEVGGAPVNLNGRIIRENETVAVSLHVDGKNVLLFRNNDMRMRGDVQLDISGPLTRLVVKGTTGLTGGYYTKNYEFLGLISSSATPVSEGVSFLFSFPEPPLKDAVFDIKITTKEPFRIRNNLARGVLRPELTLKGTGELPFLIGTLYIDPSRVLLPSGRLQIQSGLLRFLEKEPDRPQLDLLAQSRIMGYDINVAISGFIDDPVITLSSSPSLPNDELLLLLLTGQPPSENGAGGTMGRAATNVMVYLGRDFLDKWLEDESGGSNESILERFELDYGRNITKSGEQTVEATFRLSEYTTGTGKIYYLSGEKDKYDAYNYGLKLVFRFE